MRGMKSTASDPEKLLKRTIRLARKLEKLGSQPSSKKLVTTVGYGFLVRARRLAMALETIPAQCAYEALILVRTMLEIFYDYSWIRLRRKHYRSVRFIRYQPIDMLKTLDVMPTAFSPAKLPKIRRRLIAERSS